MSRQFSCSSPSRLQLFSVAYDTSILLPRASNGLVDAAYVFGLEAQAGLVHGEDPGASF